MSLVFAALVPHPPMLLPSIGKEHAKMLEKTWTSYRTIADRLAAAAPDTVIVISPHQSVMYETFTVNFSSHYCTHFHVFGDFTPPKDFKPDSQIIERIRHHGRLGGTDVSLYNETHLDYGTGVPLFFLTPDQPPLIVPVAPALGSAKLNFDFGQTLKDIVLHSRRKIAVICSGDLSHRHSADALHGYTARAKVFDDLITANLSAGSATSILQMDEKLVDEAHACGYRPICVLLGILDKIEHRPELLSYESPYGVGYATMQFHL